MHTRQSKRKRFLKRTFVSVVMTSAILVLSVGLLLIMLGYRFNREQGSITQGGLVQMITTPPGAHVTVGKAHLANVTPSKITLIPGTYPVTIEKSGYHSWNKTVTIGAGTVTWLNTARLIPTTLSPRTLAEYPSVNSALFSPRARYVAIFQDTSKPAITLGTLDQASLRTTILELPATAYSAGTTHQFVAETWSRAEQYLLVRHTYDTRTEWIVVDTADVTRSKPVSNVGEASPVSVAFDQRSSGAVLAVYSDGSIRHIVPQTGDVRTYPLHNIARISFFNDQTILYATKPTHGTVSVGYYTLDSSAARPIKSYQTESAVLVSGAKYFSDYYIALAHDKDVTILTSSTLPRSDSTERWSTTVSATYSLQAPVQTLISRANGRLVVAVHGTTQTTYDLELNRRSDVAIADTSEPLAASLGWLDDFNFVTSTGGKLRMYEFDGTNQHDLLPVVATMPASVSDNNRYLYSFSPSPTGVALQVTKLILE